MGCFGFGDEGWDIDHEGVVGEDVDVVEVVGAGVVLVWILERRWRWWRDWSMSDGEGEQREEGEW